MSGRLTEEREAEIRESLLPNTRGERRGWTRNHAAEDLLAEVDALRADYRDAQEVITGQHMTLWLVGLDTHEGEEPQPVECSVAALRKLLAAGSEGGLDV